MVASHSGRFQEGFEADAEIQLVLEAVEQGDLVQQHGAEGEALGADEAPGRDGATGSEDGLELAVEVLDGEGAEFVKDAADLDAVVGVRIPATAGGDQEAVGRCAVRMEGRVLVVGVAEDETDGLWQ